MTSVRFGRAFTVLAMAAVMAGAAPPLEAARAAGTQLVIGQLQFITNMHPMIQVNSTKRNVVYFSLWPISAFDDKGVNVCRLCETLPTLENGLAKIVDKPDGTKGMTVRINLKPGLKWGDGVPVTSKDIAFTWKIASDPEMGFSNFNPWNRASKVEIVDDRSAILYLDKPITSYNSWDQLLPEHIEGPVYAANPTAKAYLQATTYNRAITNPGLWNGPFILTEYAVGTRIAFDANPYWPGPGPQLRKIVLSYRDNSSALVQNLLSGDLDAVVVSAGGISFSQMLDIRRQFPDRFKYLVADGISMDRIAFNMDNPILADVRIRKAIAYGIDRQEIVSALFDNLQKVGDSLFSESSPYFDKGVTRYRHDLAKARALIAEAGYKPGPGGVCVNASGQKLSLELATTAGNRTREQIIQVLQNQLAQACIEIILKPAPLQEFNSLLLRERRFKGMVLSAMNFPPSVSPRIFLGSEGIPSPANNFVGNNYSGYRNPALDKEIGVIESVVSEPGRVAAWGRFQRIVMDQLPILPMYLTASSYVTVKDLTDFNFATMDPEATWADEWRRQ
jgi:peptide/nickel transport system substrate-binding protein